MANKYTESELANFHRKGNKGFGYDKLSDAAVLAEVKKLPGGEKWIADRLAPPEPTKFQKFKDLSAKAFETMRGLDTGLKAPTYAEGMKAAAAPTALIAPAVPSKPFKQTLGEAAEAAQRAVGGQLRKAYVLPPYAGAGAVKGATLGYIDPSKALPEAGVEPITQKRLSAAGEFLGAAAPISGISKVASIGLRAAGVAAAARPALGALAQAATTGLAYGGARKPAESESRAKNAINDAALFMAFTGTGLVVDKAASWYKANYTPEGAWAAYKAARQEIIDVFVAKGAQPAKAAEMAEVGLNSAIRAGGGMGKIKPSAFRDIQGKVRRGEKVVIEPEPAAPVPAAQIAGPEGRAITPTAAEMPAREIPAPVVKQPLTVAPAGPSKAEIKAQAELDKKFPQLKNPDYWLEIPGGDRFPAPTLQEASDNTVAAILDAMAEDIETAPKFLTLLDAKGNKIGQVDRAGRITSGEKIIYDPAASAGKPVVSAPIMEPEAIETPTMETIWNMPLEKWQEKILSDNLTEPPWKTPKEIRADVKKYSLAEAYRKWAAEADIKLKRSKHGVPQELIEKFKLQKDVDMAMDAELADKAAKVQETIANRGGKTPFWNLVKSMGGINRGQLLNHLQIETGTDWKGREFPEELASLVRVKGGASPGDFIQAAYYNGLIKENDPAEAIAGLLQDWRIKQAIKEGRDLSEVIEPKRDMTQYGAELAARGKPRIDLPGQQMIPGTGPAMPTGKIRKELYVDNDDFIAGFEAEAQTPSLFEALKDAEGAAGELKKIESAPGGDAAAEAPTLDRPEPEAEFQPITGDKDFKLWRVTEQLMEKYAKRFGEDKYKPRGLAGVFYRGSKNIFLNAANNVYVAIHEIVHFIDDKTGWFKGILKVVGSSKNGNPIYDPATKEIRGLLTEFYLKTYPGAKKTQPLEKRVKEGAAMLAQKAVESPGMLLLPEWKPLADMVLTPGGKYYSKDFADLVKDGRVFIEPYRNLSALEKTGARKSSGDRHRTQESMFTTMDKVQTILFDDLHPFLRFVEKTGNKWGPKDVYSAMHAYRYWGALANNNLTPKRGLWIIKNNSMLQVGDKNAGDLFEMLGDTGRIDRFDNWLIDRRVNAGYKEMEKIRQRIIKITDGIYDVEKPNMAALKKWMQEAALEREPEEIGAIIAWIRESAAEYARLAKIAAGDNIGKEVAEQGYQEGIKEFSGELEKLHDDICAAIVEMGHDVGIISTESKAKMLDDKAYASFRRDILSLLHDGERSGQAGTGFALSFIKERRGSEKAFLGPMFGLVQNLMEATRKTMIQGAKNKFYDIVEANEELMGEEAQIQKLVAAPRPGGGFDYPQLKDPNILMARRNGKYLPVAVLDQSLMDVINYKLLDPKVADVVEKVVTKFASTFTKGTTATYVFFPVSNLFVDTGSAVAQTQTKYVPFVDHIKILMEMARSDKSEMGKYVHEYMILTGGRQTLSHMYDGNRTPEEAYKWLTGETTKMATALRAVDSFLDLIATPSKVSEDFTRAVEYAKARQAGLDSIAAAEMAGEITAPFHHAGTMGGKTGRVLVRSVGFFNPTLQVFSQFGKTFENPKIRGRGIFVTAALAAAVILNSYSMRTASKRQRQNYKGKHIGERENTIWIPAPGRVAREKGRLLKFRIPENYATAGNLINMIIEERMKDDNFSGNDYLQAATAFIPDQLNPAQADRWLITWLPQIIGPSLAVKIGKKTYPKVMDLTPRTLMELPRTERYGERTSWIAKKLSKTLPEALNLNPIEIDYLIEGTLGRTTRFVTGRMGKDLFTNPFYADLYLGATRDLELFYKVRDAISQTGESYRNQIKNAAAEQGAELDVEPDASLKDMVEAAKESKIVLDELPAGFEQMMAYQEYTVPIEKKMSRYRFLSRVKNPGPATTAEKDDFRDQILEDINYLRQAYEEKKP